MYKLQDSVNEEQISLYYTFKVVNGQSDPILLDITIPKKYEGKIINEDGTSINDGWLSVSSKSSTSYSHYNAQVKNGGFSINLPDGSYEVNSYSNSVNQEQFTLSYAFSVKDGVTSPNPLSITIKNKNVFGTVRHEDGTPAGNESIYIRNTVINSTYTYNNVQVKNGQFSLYLPDGKYEVFNHYNYDAQESTQLSYTFTVADGKTNPNPLSIIIKTKNVIGTVAYEDGASAGNGSVSIRSTVTNSTYSYYNASVKNSQFSLYLPDGKYVVDYYYNSDAQESTQLSYTFTVVDGKPTPNPLSIKLKKKNVIGTMAYEDGTSVGNGSISIRTTVTNSTYSYFYPQVKNGQFSLYLPDGKYVVDYYYNSDAQESTQLSYAFTIVDGKPTPNPLSIKLKKKNVIGTMAYEDGTSAGNGSISIRTTVTNSTYSYFYPQVKNGQFSLYLPDGKYVVDYYYNSDAQESTQLSYTFTVVDGKPTPNPLSIKLKKKNVIGTMAYEDGTSVGNGSISIRTTVTNSTYSYFYPQVKNGQFSLYLPDGKYVVDYYYNSDAQESTQLSYAFTVVDGKPTPNPLSIKLKNKNVIGTVAYEDGTSAGNGSISIRTTVTNSTYSYYNASVKNGQFSLYLPDGKYEVYGYNNYDAQESTQLSYTFTVVDGKPTPNPLSIKLKNKNVIGTVA
ncbi:hypothetical protein, partial [Paenibacillus apii]|uniref:hypothetical protein n=1 Tax=Paenibacillus apii TaxID=1850370 RepID=UPI00143A045C